MDFKTRTQLRLLDKRIEDTRKTLERLEAQRAELLKGSERELLEAQRAELLKGSER